ncbi:MAG: hypothetical protein ACE5JU_02065 [Candidatus Binatia bacterium]
MSFTNYRADIFAEKIAVALTQPDSTVSHGFFDVYGRKSPVEPEKKLMLAVLEDAILCLQGKGLLREKSRKDLCQEAEQWILERDSDWLFSFENICKVLGLDPAPAREQMLCQQRRKYLCG